MYFIKKCWGEKSRGTVPLTDKNINLALKISVYKYCTVDLGTFLFIFLTERETTTDLNRTLSCDSGFYEGDDSSLLLSPSCSILSSTDSSSSFLSSSFDSSSSTVLSLADSSSCSSALFFPKSGAADSCDAFSDSCCSLPSCAVLPPAATTPSCRPSRVNLFSDVKHEVFALDFLLETTKGKTDLIWEQFIIFIAKVAILPFTLSSKQADDSTLALLDTIIPDLLQFCLLQCHGGNLTIYIVIAENFYFMLPRLQANHSPSS